VAMSTFPGLGFRVSERYRVYYRHLVAREIKDIHKNNKDNNTSKKDKREWKQIMNIDIAASASIYTN
jgi:hypothetical protein